MIVNDENEIIEGTSTSRLNMKKHKKGHQEFNYKKTNSFQEKKLPQTS